MFSKLKQIILLLGDAAVLFTSLYITLLIRYGQPGAAANWGGHLDPFSIIYFIWLLIFYSQNLYNLQFTKNGLRFFKTLFEAVLINAVIASVFFYFTPFFGIAPKTNLFLNTAIAAVLITGWRALYNLAAAKYLYKTRIAFLGYSREIQELIEYFAKEPQLGYEVAAIVHNEPTADNIGVPFITVDELIGKYKELKINTVVLHHGKYADGDTATKLYKLIFSNIAFINALKLYEDVTGRVPLETISHGWFFDNLKEAEKKIYDRLKNFADYLAGVFLSALFLSLLPLVALITATASGRPVFYTQTRIGKNGKIFKIYKFRTMSKDAESAGAQFADKNDKRVTPFGKFLRRTRIDELPQAINLFRGEMSLVGPRPERPEFTAELEHSAPFYPIRHLVKPGLTGWAQINFPYAGSIEENIKKLQYDIFYIKNRSLLLDITIMIKTLNILMRFRGR